MKLASIVGLAICLAGGIAIYLYQSQPNGLECTETIKSTDHRTNTVTEEHSTLYIKFLPNNRAMIIDPNVKDNDGFPVRITETSYTGGDNKEEMFAGKMTRFGPSTINRITGEFRGGIISSKTITTEGVGTCRPIHLVPKL